MTSRRVEWVVRIAIVLVSSFLALIVGGVRAQSTEADFLYSAKAGDTLIGIGRRLLTDPRRWHDVQLRNHITNPRRIPPGSKLAIPYAWLKLSPETATVVNLSGEVSQSGKKLAIGDVLSEGTAVHTGDNGSVTIDLPDGSVVTLQKSSVLNFAELSRVAGVEVARSIRLKLDSGRVETIVKPHGDVGRFEISTPVAVSAVRGTQFRSSFSEFESHSTTETLDGHVAVAGGAGNSVVVAAGFGTRIEADRPPLLPVVLLPPPSLAALPGVNSHRMLRIELPPVANAQQYRVQLSDDAKFSTVMTDVLTSDGQVSFADLRDGEFWIRARSIDRLGIEGTDSVARITQHVLPDPPQLVAAVPESVVSPASVHFAWRNEQSAVRYWLQISRDSSFTDVVFERKALDVAQADIERLPPGAYLWRVAAVNASGESGSWSEAQLYRRLVHMPMPEVRRLPDKHWWGSWQAIPGQTYRLQLARRADFSEVVFDQRVDVAEWRLPKLSPGAYFLRVQSIDSDGTPGIASDGRRFTIPVPLWVKLLVPVAVVLVAVL